MQGFLKIKDFGSTLLRGCLLRREGDLGLLYCPEINSQLLVNKDLYRLLLAYSDGNIDKEYNVIRSSWTKDSLEEIILKALESPLQTNESSSKNHQLPNSFRLSAPIRLIIEVTANCNQECSFCYAADEIELRREITFSQIIDLARQAAEMGVFRIHLLGGEPLLRNDISDILSGISALGLFVSLTTNGILIEPLIPSLKSVQHLLPLQISLHSLRAPVYEKYNIPFEFQNATVRNCRLLANAGIKFGIKAVISQYNYDEVYELANFAAQLGARSITFLNIIPFGRGKQSKNILDLSGDYMRTIVSDLKRAKDLPIYLDQRALINLYFPKDPTSPIEEYVECPSGNLDMRIRSDGMAIQCSAIRDGMFDSSTISLKEAWSKFVDMKQPCPILKNGIVGKCEATLCITREPRTKT